MGGMGKMGMRSKEGLRKGIGGDEVGLRTLGLMLGQSVDQPPQLEVECRRMSRAETRVARLRRGVRRCMVTVVTMKIGLD